MQRSTKTTIRKTAQKLADQFEEASQRQTTELQARRIISDIHHNLTGRQLRRSNVREFLTSWLKNKEGSVADSTLDAYRNVKKEFCLHLGDRAEIELAFVTKADIAKFRDKMAKKASVRTANGKLKILRIAFQEAWREELIESNPAAKVPVLKASHGGPKRRAFTLEELQKVYAVADDNWKGMILFGLYTGQRLGDIASVRWDQIDMKTLVASFETQKTGRQQILPIGTPLATWLKSRPRKRSGNLFPDAYQILKKDGKSTALSKQFRDFLVIAELAKPRNHQRTKTAQGRSGTRNNTELSFHCLRHTATSLMKNAGVSPAIVQEFIGHDSKIISENYTHIETESLRKAAELLPALE